MLESSLEFFRCVRCGSKLELDVFKLDREIEEGLLECKKCNLIFPILQKIPILWDDFSDYLSNHKVLSGILYKSITSESLRKFVKYSLSKTDKFNNDSTITEKRWSLIYQNSRCSKFYSHIKNNLDFITHSNFVLEHGCSIGIMTSWLSDSHQMVFGIDRSFDALLYAKKSYKHNLDYAVADSLSDVFGKFQFDLILALNVLELIEPTLFLKQTSAQITSGYLVITDPYDFDRGVSSVKTSFDEFTLRTNLEYAGFKILPKTSKPSFIPWNLKVNPRATLNYKVDLVIGKK
ncbi:MAG: methyltransferase domain-containing protein [Nitrosopumilus sp.]|nr:methyltransferase domain-containing protein [Nitrosopumilus sp.]